METDANDVMGCADVKASKISQGRVVVSGGVVSERARSDSRVEIALGVSKKRSLTDCRVEVAGGVTIQRTVTAAVRRWTDCLHRCLDAYSRLALTVGSIRRTTRVGVEKT